MLIESLKLSNFRNHKNLKIDQFKKINIIHGDNGVGKTSIIEAIHLTIMGKSFKELDNKNIINFNESFSNVILTIRGDNENIASLYFDNKTTELYFNKQKETFKNLRNKFNVVLFEPNTLANLMREKKHRINFIDKKLSGLKPIYSFLLSKTRKLEHEKKTFLKSGLKDINIIKILNKQLANLYKEMIEFRVEFISDINDMFEQNLKQFNIELTSATVTYDCEYLFKSEDYIYNKLNANIEAEIASKRLSYSSTKDDIAIDINNKNIIFYASQGQKRLCLINLIIVIASLYERKTGHKPIVLLDDVFSELDKHNMNTLVNYVNKAEQAFISTNSVLELEVNKDVFLIEL